MSLNESSGESESRTRDWMRDTFRTTPSQPIPIPFPYPFQSPCFPFFHSLSHFHCRLAFLVYKFLWPKNACLMAGIVRVCVCVSLSFKHVWMGISRAQFFPPHTMLSHAELHLLCFKNIRIFCRLVLWNSLPAANVILEDVLCVCWHFYCGNMCRNSASLPPPLTTFYTSPKFYP